MRKLILQIRYTIFSRLLCVRHLQTILPYSPYLYGIFAFYSNFSPLPEFTFAKRKVFWLNWNLLFQFTKFGYEEVISNFCRICIGAIWTENNQIDDRRFRSGGLSSIFCGPNANQSGRHDCKIRIEDERREMWVFVVNSFLLKI